MILRRSVKVVKTGVVMGRFSPHFTKRLSGIWSKLTAGPPFHFGKGKVETILCSDLSPCS
jgi:hypothetical protein